MKLRLVLLFTALSTISALGQTKASVDPPQVEAGQNITITVTLDRAPSVQGTAINIVVAPRNQDGNPSQFTVGVFSKDGDPEVVSNTTQIPPNAKGVWYIRDAYSQINSVTTPIDLLDHPEFTVKPIEITLPKTAKVSIVVP